jgi:hydroquinone glucosyltransferase
MVAWPLYAKQRMNATMLVEEVGVAIKPAVEGGKRVVVREEIESVVRMVMESEEGKMMRRRAGELKVSAKKALNISLNERGAKWS